MDDFIINQSLDPKLTIAKFSNNLKAALQTEMTDKQKETGSIIQVAGYTEENLKSHAEFYLVTNIHNIDPLTGNYSDITNKFTCSEHFWNRDYKIDNFKENLEKPNKFAYRIYFNGTKEGRNELSVIREKLDAFFIDLWRIKDLKFRAPASLVEMELLVRNYMQIIISLYALSDYEAKPIGGEIQIVKIPQPENIIFCNTLSIRLLNFKKGDTKTNSFSAPKTIRSMAFIICSVFNMSAIKIVFNSINSG